MTDSASTPNVDNPPNKWPLIVGALVIAAAFVTALLLINTGDDDQSGGSATAPADTGLADTGVATTGLATTEVPPATDAPKPAVWPWAGTSTRYADPVDAAIGFATEFLSFDEPIVGAFQQGDSRSGEVEVRAFESGPVTVVLVRQLATDDSWWILGSVSDNIDVVEPEAGADVASPLAVSGTSSAAEGTVDVQLRADGSIAPFFEGFVTGGAIERGPFSGTFEFTRPVGAGGALVIQTFSAEDGSLIEASVLRIFYG
jgi:hypothetical protein